MSVVRNMQPAARKLLVVAQVLDETDPVLGFFTRWVEELAPHFEKVSIICLFEGVHQLPKNVAVYSLGKEKGRQNALIYAWRFFRLSLRLHAEYDAVFVHMNQEYLLISGWLWKLFGKRVFLWRNHYAGSTFTDLAAFFADTVFCTSTHSYTAKYRKTVLMPVGVDTKSFKEDPNIVRVPRSILFLARMAPSKRPEMLLAALALLKRDGVSFTATFAGSPLPKDAAYYEQLLKKTKELGLTDSVLWLPGPQKSETPRVYQSHEIFVNASPSGMLDKTIFEAAACGCLVLAASEDVAEVLGADFYFATEQELADRLRALLIKTRAPDSTRDLRHYAAENSLDALAASLAHILSTPEKAPRARV